MSQLSPQTAAQVHNAGRLADAEAIYGQIATVELKHPVRTLASLQQLARLLVLASASLVALGCRPKMASAPAGTVTREMTASGERFGVAQFSLSKSTLHVFWKKSDGSRLGTFERLNALLSSSGERLIFATNGGIFDANFSPCGLYVENGLELVPLNLGRGSGNFYLQPNGVFFIDSHGAAIIDSSKYSLVVAKPKLAVQSGPMLVIDGRINPALAVDSENRRTRSGIGLISSDEIVFAISRQPVTFHDFASVFRDSLHCSDALYLDGEISRFYPDPIRSSGEQDNFAAMFAVTER